jgi:hypothetical protein
MTPTAGGWGDLADSDRSNQANPVVVRIRGDETPPVKLEAEVIADP